ncbi:enoyl-CoA hydratase-related protein [Pelagimonas sp. KU-00592-HH]|uniref:enoyl-CoA hydratase/isomerase family protein n=1 Tax=Pelagimonas sp. KU-00592-HH TaxID=3127651 RepID=UPI003109F8B4
MTQGSDLLSLAEHRDGIWHLKLSAPRANALEPVFLDIIRAAMDRIEATAPRALVMTAGRNFCSGGDVARFFEAVKAGQGKAYTQSVVPVLQEIVLRLTALPAPVVIAARGANTGGGCGFLFASDLAVIHPTTFVQPYYARVGFAPDGGWTALLPERIGAGPALAWLQEDARKSCADLRALGLASHVSDTPEAKAFSLLDDVNLATLATAKTLVWDAERLARLDRRLKAETEAFFQRIDQPDTLQGMTAFLTPQEA